MRAIGYYFKPKHVSKKQQQLLMIEVFLAVILSLGLADVVLHVLA